MSLLHLLRMPTTGARGELRVVDPAEQTHFGHFELQHPVRRDVPNLKLYFAYDTNPSPVDMGRGPFHDAIQLELTRFYNAITAIQSLNPYVLKEIHIPLALPLTSDRLSLV